MEKEFDESNTVFSEVLKKQPSNVTVRRYLAANLWQLRKYPEAKQNLEILLKQAPQDRQSRLLLGMVSENMHDYARAAELLASVSDETEQRPESLAALARSYYHLNRDGDAQATLAKMSKFSQSGNAILLGAQIADEAGDFSTEQQLLLSIAPNLGNQALIGYRIALAQFHAKQFEESQRTLLRLIEQNDGNSEIYNLLAWNYQNLGEGSKAAQTLEQLIEQFPNDETNYLDLIKIRIAQRSFSAALSIAKRVTLSFPQSARAFELRGQAEEKMERFRDAVESYSQAWHLDRTRPDALLGLAEAQSATALTQESSTNFETGIKTFPHDLRFKVQYAASLLKLAETGDASAEAHAENLLQSALTANRSLPAAHYELGNLALKRGRTAEALEHLEQAEKLAPESSQVHFALANAYRRLGRRDKSSEEMDLYQRLRGATEAESSPEAASDKAK
jgi:tetratricopeptide (TPR) repeat protein